MCRALFAARFARRVCLCVLNGALLLFARGRVTVCAGKYPDEDHYNAFLNSNGGSSNAFTSNEVRGRKALFTSYK